MLKKLIITLFVLGAFIAPKNLFAQEENICVQVYGGGVVCGAKHEVVDTDFGDVNTFAIGAGFLLASFGLYRLFKKLSCQSAS